MKWSIEASLFRPEAYSRRRLLGICEKAHDRHGLGGQSELCASPGWLSERWHRSVEAGNPGTIVGNLAAHAPSPVEPARPTLPAPIQTKPAAVLADYGLQLDQHECSARSRPNASNDQRIGLEVRQQPRLPARWRLRTRS